ncbi:hypothetical protein RHSIM_Rhsim06G0185700 [Rhododendron simsii]|uniref:Uncharacterized protein n=1 Tax=Rhododendron simsii TaxID=118357 RepID=A0A834GWJ5_RHOSS|nr:hypothetical protein RHSIM_Rhsim06G0185700 [Rhododendron simsii]
MESRMHKAAMKCKPDILNEYTDQCALKFTPNNNTVLHVIAELGHSLCVAGGHYHAVKSLINFAKSNDPLRKGGEGDVEGKKSTPRCTWLRGVVTR